MAAAHANVTFVKSANAVFNNLEGGDVNMQPFLIYSPGYEDNSRDTDEEFLNPDCYDELDVLATGLKSERKLKLRKSVLEKEK